MSALKKFRNAIKKKSDKYNVGFSVIPEWVSTGNLALNAIISGDPNRGWPVGRTSMISGLQGSGKSFLTANAIAQAQQMGYFAIVLDTENSLGDDFMTKIGVSLDPDHFMPVSVYSVEETTAFFSDLFKNTEREDKICVIVDSLSNLETERDMKKFDDGDVAYGQGLKEKLYKQLVRNVNSKIGQRNMMCIFNTHMYVAGSDSYGNPILRPSCGTSTLFIPSVGIELRKADLKEGREQIGITITAKTYKSRYTSLGQVCTFNLPWETGMDPYEGLLPFLEKTNAVEKNGSWYHFHDVNEETGEVETIKFQRGDLNEHVEKILTAFSNAVGDPEEGPESDASIEMLDDRE